MHEPEMPILSVTEFNQMVKEVLTEIKAWVQGEISGFKISQNKWVTFDLKDEGSRVNCFMTKYQLDQVLEDGMEVKVFGNPSIYVPYGKYSFVVQRVEPVGEGALRRAFELTKKKLDEEGVFDPVHKKEIPRFPETIGIVSSEGAAAYTDFLKIVNNRWGGVTTILRPSLVQGNNAPTELVAAIEWFNKYNPVDVIVVTRGGGSLEDLQAFNSEQVCRAVFASRIPIVCGVGHERDVTLAELAADVRASTPSNAAEMVVPDRQEIIRQLDQAAKTMAETLDDRLEDYSRELSDIVSRLDDVLSDKISEVNVMEHRLQLSFQTYHSKVAGYKEKLKSSAYRLTSSFDTSLKYYFDNLTQANKLLASFSPQGVLKRGYSIARLGNGEILSSVKQVKKGQIIQTELIDGALDSEVLGKKKGVEVNGRLV